MKQWQTDVILDGCAVVSTFALLVIAGYQAERAGRPRIKSAFMIAARIVLALVLPAVIFALLFRPA